MEETIENYIWKHTNSYLRTINGKKTNVLFSKRIYVGSCTLPYCRYLMDSNGLLIVYLYAPFILFKGTQRFFSHIDMDAMRKNRGIQIFCRSFAPMGIYMHHRDTIWRHIKCLWLNNTEP